MIGAHRKDIKMKTSTIEFKAWNPDTHQTEPTGEAVSIYQLARSMTPENFAALLEDYLNLGGKQYQEGRVVGLYLRHTHRTLQRLAVCFALGVVAGLSEQDHTDPRNESAIATAKRIAQMVREGDLPLGMYL